MILVDTSVWIDFFRRRKDLVSEFNLLLEAQKLLAYEPVFSELLFGIRNEREGKIIRSFWEVLPKVAFDSGAMLRAAELAVQEDFQNKGIGLMDALIMKACLENNYLLWSFDKRILSHLEARYAYQSLA
jgi:predicted nucleic acid-binding protein